MSNTKKSITEYNANQIALIFESYIARAALGGVTELPEASMINRFIDTHQIETTFATLPIVREMVEEACGILCDLGYQPVPHDIKGRDSFPAEEAVPAFRTTTEIFLG